MVDGGASSITAMAGSTEEEQFEDEAELNAQRRKGFLLPSSSAGRLSITPSGPPALLFAFEPATRCRL